MTAYRDETETLRARIAELEAKQAAPRRPAFSPLRPLRNVLCDWLATPTVELLPESQDMPAVLFANLMLAGFAGIVAMGICEAVSSTTSLQFNVLICGGYVFGFVLAFWWVACCVHAYLRSAFNLDDDERREALVRWLRR